MLANQIMAVLIGCLASVGAYHMIRRMVVGGASLGVKRSSSLEEERLARIEQALDSVTLEMERVSEAQRFTTRLLMERLPERQPDQLPPRGSGRQPGIVTPH